MIYNSALSEQNFKTKPLFVSVPHSGEEVPEEAKWLLSKKTEVFLCDVDRFVDQLYLPVIRENQIPSIYSSCHRYALDLNRLATDISEKTVKAIQGNISTRSGLASGLYWTKTTKGDVLLPNALDWLDHKSLLDKVYHPFHNTITSYQNTFLNTFGVVYHLDLHSMPSYGTTAHRDNGSKRPEVVISDLDGKSSSSFFVDLVKNAFSKEFNLSYNWPYKGGGVTHKHSCPEKQCNTLQIEIRRDLYMNEVSKDLLPSHAQVQEKLQKCINEVFQNL